MWKPELWSDDGKTANLIRRWVSEFKAFQPLKDAF